jgi:hypothetical protein
VEKCSEEGYEFETLLRRHRLVFGTFCPFGFREAGETGEPQKPHLSILHPVREVEPSGSDS